ncbi:hypothetical protein K435DRAFT_963202 [Dendrothele bispora CBS 962.96]|uniref:Uncharacterized protein n=1 Tax=Dendrothele bispora (strain CBS 962.96) TaxID=1314807 RepID=A0A4S8MIJ5_DENBC|nr:hypothetical protein K435DRAFT_963202 [Dendrothele bispora CBS 962.96]
MAHGRPLSQDLRCSLIHMDCHLHLEDVVNCCSSEAPTTTAITATESSSIPITAALSTIPLVPDPFIVPTSTSSVSVSAFVFSIGNSSNNPNLNTTTKATKKAVPVKSSSKPKASNSKSTSKSKAKSSSTATAPQASVSTRPKRNAASRAQARLTQLYRGLGYGSDG